MQRFLSSTTMNRAPVAFNAMDVPTVAIKTDNGPVRINMTDYDPKVHELHKGDDTHDDQGVLRKPPAPEVPANETAPGASPSPPAVDLTPEQIALNERINNAKLGVIQQGAKFYVVDSNEPTAPITDIPGITSKGYKSNKDAWDALFAVQASAKAGTAQ